MDLTQATSPILAFWHKLEMNSYDDVYVYASDDGGASWTQFLRLDHTSNMTTWSLHQLDLAPYAGRRVRILFRLFDEYGTSTLADGWYLDDIEIREAQ